MCTVVLLENREKKQTRMSTPQAALASALKRLGISAAMSWQAQGSRQACRNDILQTHLSTR